MNSSDGRMCVYLSTATDGAFTCMGPASLIYLNFKQLCARVGGLVEGGIVAAINCFIKPATAFVSVLRRSAAS